MFVISRQQVQRQPSLHYFIDIFIFQLNKIDRYTILDSLTYCQQQKGLVLYDWCLMSNHLHVIAKANEGFKLSDILRDFKKFTSKAIINQIKEIPESRREWMLYRFENAGKHLKRISHYKFWKDDNHAILLDNAELMQQKLDYIHANLVVAEIVLEDIEYKYSSAKYYANEPTIIECERLE